MLFWYHSHISATMIYFKGRILSVHSIHNENSTPQNQILYVFPNSLLWALWVGFLKQLDWKIILSLLLGRADYASTHGLAP